MADLSKITLPNNVSYNLKDTTARNFIDNLEEEFYIDHLGSGTMLLTSTTVRLSFRKF